MSDEIDSRVLAKLILLEQACCDARLDASHMRTLAVILDACYDKPRCFIGPTAIGKIAGINERTVRNAIDGLVGAGYLDTESRTKRSNWLSPNFKSAMRSGCLVTYKDRSPEKVHRPFRAPKWSDEIAGVQTRYKGKKQTEIAGVQNQASGSTDPTQRVYRPTEAVKEAIKEAVRAPRSGFDHEKQEQERSPEEEIRLTASARKLYVEAMQKGHQLLMESTERNHWHRIADLVPEGRLPPLVA